CSPAIAATRTWTDPNVLLVLAGPETGSVVGASGEVGRVGWVWPRQAIPAAVSEAVPAATGGGPPIVSAGWARDAEQFDSRDAVITKAEVRALALARLAPAPGTLVWDVGAGSGSVGVECARFAPPGIALPPDPPP